MKGSDGRLLLQDKRLWCGRLLLGKGLSVEGSDGRLLLQDRRLWCGRLLLGRGLSPWDRSLLLSIIQLKEFLHHVIHFFKVGNNLWVCLELRVCFGLGNYFHPIIHGGGIHVEHYWVCDGCWGRFFVSIVFCLDDVVRGTGFRADGRRFDIEGFTLLPT